MADPRTMHLDTLTRRWDLVAELVHCAYCLGALPPDVDGACEECGTGTPMPGETAQWLQEVAGRELTPWQRSLVEADHMPLPSDVAARIRPIKAAALPVEPAPAAEPIGWMTMLKSWARWPNHD